MRRLVVVGVLVLLVGCTKTVHVPAPTTTTSGLQWVNCNSPREQVVYDEINAARGTHYQCRPAKP